MGALAPIEIGTRMSAIRASSPKTGKAGIHHWLPVQSARNWVIAECPQLVESGPVGSGSHKMKAAIDSECDRNDTCADKERPEPAGISMSVNLAPIGRTSGQLNLARYELANRADCQHKRHEKFKPSVCHANDDRRIPAGPQCGIRTIG
ncbi:hypothetical protein IAG41_07080 [Sphingomonas sp. JC676]|uniref:hypothetical protein n=1 Tax=Sphingomonas sp. JC676 TaxID=2768065 RepID=UPI0016583E6D|nr:hypothetical protein [Sphingomonas sp. JC676]MBC9032149.1 hypothetical protein [Sphingomonas sp. JC676]